MLIRTQRSERGSKCPAPKKAQLAAQHVDGQDRGADRVVADLTKGREPGRSGCGGPSGGARACASSRSATRASSGQSGQRGTQGRQHHAPEQRGCSKPRDRLLESLSPKRGSSFSALTYQTRACASRVGPIGLQRPAVGGPASAARVAATADGPVDPSSAGRAELMVSARSSTNVHRGAPASARRVAPAPRRTNCASPQAIEVIPRGRAGQRG